MSLRLQARMALFTLQTKAFVHEPGEDVDLTGTFGAGFPTDTRMMATVNWIADPQLGFVAAPFKIRVAKEPLSVGSFGNTKSLLELRRSNNYSISLLNDARGQSGIFCLSARLAAADAKTEIYATDMLGNEIPQTRQTATAPNGAVLFGPDIFGLRANGDVKLTDVSIFAIPDNPELETEIVAEVGPPFSSVSRYQNQTYLGVKHPPVEAAALRLQADALTRENTTAPQPSRLLNEIHRRDPISYARDFLRTKRFVTKSENNIDSLVGNGDWSYSEPIQGAAGELRVYPSRLWQYLALVGPVEAAFLGQSVSFPLAAGFTALTTGPDIFQVIKESNHLPFPLVIVEATHLLPATGEGASTEFRHNSFARLCLPTTTFDISVSATGPRIPTKRDAPATSDIEFRFQRRLNSNVHFIERKTSAGDGIFENDETDFPKAHFAGSSAKDLSSAGAPTCRVGPVNLPLDGPGELPLADHSRDVFGRWTAPIAVKWRASGLACSGAYSDISRSELFGRRAIYHECRVLVGMERSDAVRHSTRYFGC